MLSTNGIVIRLTPLYSLDSALLDTIKIFICSLEKRPNLEDEMWYSVDIDMSAAMNAAMGTAMDPAVNQAVDH
jgi:hypothetical protein